jgi:ionotropic glutamate receptor NMDA 2B
MERTESRIFLLYCTKKEAKLILEQSSLIGLTGKNYIWIATQAVIGKYLKNDPLIQLLADQ